MFPFNNNNRNSGNFFDSLFSDNFLGNMVDQLLSSNIVNNLTEEILKEDDYDVELKDFGDYYLIKGYLPGLSPKDISIDFEKNKAILTIKRKKVYSNESNTIVTVIKGAGDWVKNFYIEEVDVTKMKASFDDNLLLLTLPKIKKIEGLSDDSVIIDVNDYREE
ncbi:MAG: Hsp20 family protein [Clostridium sp.]|nr:Hsp20 family protein [Clostridium sp.]